MFALKFEQNGEKKAHPTFLGDRTEKNMYFDDLELNTYLWI